MRSIIIVSACLSSVAAFQDPPGVVVDADYNSWLRECVPPFKAGHFAVGASVIAESNYQLIHQPGGLCADILSCAFENCTWTSEASLALSTHDMATTDFKDIINFLPPLNLPGKVAIVKSVRDVVDAITYAGRNNLKVSIKTSGHSYIGSSTFRDSLLLNMNSFPKYAQSGKSIVECNALNGDGPLHACALALARGKKASMRVGGGENWDETYRGVLSWNNGSSTTKYIVVGGGAGTVSAAGGWLQGGGLGTHVDRTFGFGVDQVLQLEMVLADGAHVRFGPTKWQHVDDHLYPKTIKVDGECNPNVDLDESQWQWGPCDVPRPFQKLWFAVRGGGGGTYGVVTAVHVQLHERAPFSSLAIKASSQTAIANRCKLFQCGDKVTKLLIGFYIDFFFNPSALLIDEKASAQCGSPSLVLGGAPNIFCQGDGAGEKFVAAWQTYMGQAVAADKFFVPLEKLLTSMWEMSRFPDYPSMTIVEGAAAPFFPSGHVPDIPTIATSPYTEGSWSALVPKAWLIAKTDMVYDMFMHYYSDSHVIGGNTAIASDQMNAVTETQRMAGLQMSFPVSRTSLEILGRYRQEFLEHIPHKAGAFPGWTELNHIGLASIGPLKINWTIPCTYTTKEALEEHCISYQESVWGADLLKQLEGIKAEVDPHSMFTCFGCVGHRDVSVGRSGEIIV